MVVGLGIDIVDCQRLRRVFERHGDYTIDAALKTVTFGENIAADIDVLVFYVYDLNA